MVMFLSQLLLVLHTIHTLPFKKIVDNSEAHLMTAIEFPQNFSIPSPEASSANIHNIRVKREIVAQDCTVDIIVDDHFLKSKNGNKNETESNIFSVMRMVNELSTKIFKIGFPVISLKYARDIKQLNNLNSKNGNGLPDIQDKLNILKSAIVQDPELKEKCLVYLFTSQKFRNNVLGTALLGSKNSAGGICDKSGQNIAIVNNRDLSDKLISFELLTETARHETGHAMGAVHDPPSTNPKIMNSVVMGGNGQNDFSASSLQQIRNYLNDLRISTKNCLLTRGQTAYLQYGNTVPVFK